MANINESFSWSYHSNLEWKEFTEKFERVIFEMSLNTRIILQFLRSLSNAFYPNQLERYELYDSVYAHLLQLRLLDQNDLTVNKDLNFIDLLNKPSLKWNRDSSRFTPLLIYSRKLLTCFDPIDGISITVFEDLKTTQFMRMPLNVISVMLFVLCKVRDYETIDLVNVKNNNDQFLTLGFLIHSTILKCCGMNENAIETQCIIHPIKNMYYLQKWARYGFAMIQHITEMVCYSMTRMLFFDINLVNALTQSRQPLLNRFQILTIKPLKPLIHQISDWYDFHIALTLFEPIITRTIKDSRVHGTGQELTDDKDHDVIKRLRDLPSELRINILGQPQSFQDYYCGYSGIKDTFHTCQDGTPPRRWQKTEKASFLFPISIRKRSSLLHSKATDIYIILRTQFIREPFPSHGAISSITSIPISDRRQDTNITFIEKSHFDGPSYNMNDQVLKLLPTPDNIIEYKDGSHANERDNPFYKKDCHFEGIRMKCECSNEPANSSAET